MKVIIEINGRSREVDSSKWTSADDIRKEVMDLTFNPASASDKDMTKTELKDHITTTTLQGADAFEKMFKIHQEERKEAITIFCKACDEYNNFLDTHKLEGKDCPDELIETHKVLLVNVSKEWKNLGRFEGLQKFLISEYPSIKKIYKTWEKVLKATRKK